MRFFDCNCFFGLPTRRPLLPVPTAEQLLVEMDRAGVERALVWHIAQHDASPYVGNQLLEEAIRPHPRLWGCWTVLPNQTHEFPQPAVFFQQMRKAREASFDGFIGKPLDPDRFPEQIRKILTGDTVWDLS